MYITAPSLDDLLRHILEKLLQSKQRLKPTRGEMVELTGVLLKLKDPRARLSRTETKGKIYSCLGELLWYLSKDNLAEPVVYYISRYKDEIEEGRIWGGYGPRLFAMRETTDQVSNVINLLRHNPASRRAVMQLFNAEDIAGELNVEKRHKDVPCTSTLQFLVRHGRLEMFVNMRSNDALFGLPHDVFAFTMLQEIVARSLNIEVGSYKHFATSLHLYTKYFDEAKRFLDEGWQSTTLRMPPMPIGEPWTAIDVLLKLESDIRCGLPINKSLMSALKPYWADLVHLLQIYSFRDDNREKIAAVRKKMSSDVYDIYIKRRQKAKAPVLTSEQLQLNVDERQANGQNAPE